ncbi:hypothetical protein [Micromonospora cathayae]|uniref:Uncharacterized protein n=1 Tax=Micromonospora cathayae TaxID=3028804 RepID=A0ABY7ZVP3_9ACTN|nr:hypothetical protein [Micromonospora sp. HUAS 3]WDZ87126.1 hypothetical protein PVK37_12310 [Micromonospora sp. HUAS 3]
MLATGPANATRREVLAALLDVQPALLAVPDDSYLVARYAPAPTRVAWVPGYRQPHSYGADALAVGPALSRPPRRVELSLPAPLLRHTAVVGAPDTDLLGVAGFRVLLDAAGRGGALLFVIAADQVFTPAELDLLATAARTGIEVFFVVPPGASGGPAPQAAGVPAAADDVVPGAGRVPAGTDGSPAVPDGVVPEAGGAPVPSDTGGVASEASGVTSEARGVPAETGGGNDTGVRALRAALLAAVPELVGAPWRTTRPDDVDALRRTLVDWATEAAPRRLGGGPPPVARPHRAVPVAVDIDGPGWADQLDRQARTDTQRIRQHVSLELANIHLRAVQEIVFGAGCAGLPGMLDREVHALSLLATAQCDLAVRRIVTDAFTAVFGVRPDETSYRRICAAVRAELPDHRPGRGLARVLLVTSTGGVADLSGTGAVEALDCHPGAPHDGVLPPVAVALSGGCYLHWRGPGNADQGEARSWVQRVLREIERELQAEVSRRVEAVRLALGAVLSDAVDHGILLA